MHGAQKGGEKMNVRKDIEEIMRFLFKQLFSNINVDEKINYTALGKKYGCDPRTIKRYFMLLKAGETEASKKVEKPSKIRKFEEKIKEKLKYYAPAISIFKFLKGQGYLGSYSLLTRFIRTLNHDKEVKLVARFETEPGQQAQVDWKENLKFVKNDGTKFIFNVFLITLGFSRKKFLVATENKTLETVLDCLSDAFLFYGGIPKEILFDNMKSITDKSRTQGDEAVYNERFLAFANDIGFKPKNCMAYRPETKGKVEVVAKIMNRLKVYNDEIQTFEDLQRIARELNEEINNVVCQSTLRIPNELFESKEKDALTPLPTHFMDLIRDYLHPLPKRKVSKDCTFQYKICRYSVPSKYVNKYITILEEDGILTITDEKGNYINTHTLVTNKKYNYHKSDLCELLSKTYMRDCERDEIEEHAERLLDVYDKICGN